MKRSILLTSLALIIALSSGCAMWEVSAARAAKKRETQTGPVMGELEQDTGIEDPLGRKENDLDSEADKMETKLDNL